eukprot:XP_001705520.1 Hypothetical protein GL50803_38078 [Giardia lamblia ATCC 50803]
MGLSHLLPQMFCTGSIDNRRLHPIEYLLVDMTAECLNRRLFFANSDDDWLLKVNLSSARLCINAYDAQLLPYSVKKLIQIPLVLTGNGYPVWKLIKEIQLLYGDAIYLVDHIERRHVDTIAFYYVNEIVDGDVCILNSDICIVDFILAEDGSNKSF